MIKSFEKKSQKFNAITSKILQNLNKSIKFKEIARIKLNEKKSTKLNKIYTKKPPKL